MPARGGRWGDFPERRARQLQRLAQLLQVTVSHQGTGQQHGVEDAAFLAREERIVELEMENAVLHLKLAERPQRHRTAGTRRHAGPLEGARSPLLQLQQAAQRLKQDMRGLQSSSRELLRSCRDQHRDCLSEIVTAVQRAQLPHEALPSWRARALGLEQSLQEVSERYHRERQRRRRLHNQLVELRGNIRVHCRVRPLLPGDRESDDPASHDSSASGEGAFAVDDETVLVRCSRPGHPAVNKTFNFERVYGPAEGQAAVFADVCPLITSLLDGYDVCIMAYGQTGGGKTHTMLGPQPPEASPGDLGIVPRAAEELFRLISESPAESPQVHVSVMEVYNNDICDLLAKDSRTAMSGVRREVLTTKEGKKAVSPLTCVSVQSSRALMELVGAGLQLRARRATFVHADSSRSHLVVTVTLTAAAPGDSAPESQSGPSLLPEPDRPSPRLPATGRRPSAARRASSGSPGHADRELARLQLVDLAGSECAGVSGVTGPALRETSFVNRSLAALADVLGALAERRGHVPYRNSRLTHLLQDALGGDSKLLVVLCVSPCRQHAAETLQSLGFGARTRQVERARPAPRGPR